ncbi:HSP20 family protein [Microbacteriaceae bacterium SG_E_30_P1]|uniref:HSP20 family protein n=1 Tax=Antiquaquibacter oligotrophicus TaxID=2880260 RepID=A0ABT6KJC3_9MICO|nr:Hsp20/alpha crystallin family protein [Antiquaquibacter oligotrophicus]MDH6180005.1 HSP20 family protein [Antiquaquibacter oligotrophicus]UDF14240.1 Hsp20/alpha crystallin family protein [Antiquaquibacter oligotrophicus]
MAVLFDPFRELERGATRQGLRRMPIDLYRDGDHYVLTADLPGVDPGSVDVDVDGQLLTIRAERTTRSQGDVKWLTRERQGGAYLRQLTLGQGIDTASISANYENGVLSVVIPVSEQAKPRKVAVSTGTPAAETAEAAEVTAS